MFLDFYFKPKSFEKNGTIYKYLGIKIFKKYLPSGDLLKKILNTKDKLFIQNQSVKELKSYEFLTRIAEAGHLIVSMLVTYGLVYYLQHDSYAVFATGLIINLLGNIYPVMLQRYNRVRVYKILEKKTAKRSHRDWLKTRQNRWLFCLSTEKNLTRSIALL